MDDAKIAGKKGTPQTIHELQPTVLLDVPGTNGNQYFPAHQQTGGAPLQQAHAPRNGQQQHQPQYYPAGLQQHRQNGGGDGGPPQQHYQQQQQWR